MNKPTAQQLLLAATDPADAFGPRGISVIIAGHECRAWHDDGWWHVRHSVGQSTHDFPRDRFSFVQVCDAMAKHFGGEG